MAQTWLIQDAMSSDPEMRLRDLRNPEMRLRDPKDLRWDYEISGPWSQDSWDETMRSVWQVKLP